jgi:hypothetical protein
MSQSSCITVSVYVHDWKALTLSLEQSALEEAQRASLKSALTEKLSKLGLVRQEVRLLELTVWLAAWSSTFWFAECDRQSSASRMCLCVGHGVCNCPVCAHSLYLLCATAQCVHTRFTCYVLDMCWGFALCAMLC